MNTPDTQLDPRMHPEQAVYGVIGNPVAHSLSPVIHAQFALQVKHPIYYGKLYADLGQFSQTVDTFFARGGQGLNVTVPFKLEAFQICQKLTERARAAGVAARAVGCAAALPCPQACCCRRLLPPRG